jgi:hypothetical protein
LTDHLLANCHTRGAIDQTLFVQKVEDHLILVHVYVEDVIFGSTSDDLCKEFEVVMKKKFEKSSIREMTFFWVFRLSKMTKELSYIKASMSLTYYPSSVLLAARPLLTPDPDGEDVDQHLYRSMIGSFMYLTASRQDIMFLVF